MNKILLMTNACGFNIGINQFDTELHLDDGQLAKIPLPSVSFG